MASLHFDACCFTCSWVWAFSVSPVAIFVRQEIPSTFMPNCQPHKAFNPSEPLVSVDEETLGNIEEEFNRLLANNPDNLAVLNLLGNIYIKRQQPHKAERFFRQAANLQSADAATYANLGFSLLLQGRSKESSRYLQLAVKAGLQDPGIYYQLSQIHSRLGNTGIANKWRRKAEKAAN